MFDAMKEWASRPGWHGSGFTRISSELAELPGHPARVAARRHKGTVETVLATRFAELGLVDAAATARDVALLIEGANALMLIHGDLSYAESAGAAAETLVRLRTRPARRVRRRATRHDTD